MSRLASRPDYEQALRRMMCRPIRVIGIRSQQGGQLRPQDGLDRVVGRRNAHCSGRLVPELANSREFGFDLFKTRRNRLQQTFPRFGRRNAARGARQKANAQSRFKRANGVAQGRLRYSDLCGGPGKAPLAGDGDEGKQVVEILAWHWRVQHTGLCRSWHLARVRIRSLARYSGDAGGAMNPLRTGVGG